MIITEKFINHYFPEKITNFKSEYFRLFDIEMQTGQDAPVKGWKWKYIGKELSDEQMTKINEYFSKHIVPKLRENKNVLFSNLSFDDLESVNIK